MGQWTRRRKRALVLAGGGAAVALVFVYVPFVHLGLHNLFIVRGPELTGEAAWEDMGPVPLAEKGYTPQGMTWVDGRIIFANTWKDTRSRVYEFDPETMKELRHFDLPAEAVHNAGLAWDGVHLWAVDYATTVAHCIDLEPSLEAGEAKVIGQFDTALSAAGACCIVPWNGKQCLAIADFMASRRTVFVRMHEALEAGTAAGAVEFDYRNENFPQGLTYADGFLYEAENKWSTSIINKIDLARLRETRDARAATVKQYPAPGPRVEDLAWDGSSIWTSDEALFRFFKWKLK